MFDRLRAHPARPLLACVLASLAMSTAFASAVAADGSTPADAVAAVEPPAEGDSASASELATVVVTGEGTDAGLQATARSGALGSRRLLDTPFSVTRVDQDDIARRQATTLGQVFANDPSVFAAEPSASTPWWGTQIRGIGVYNHYVDGVPLLMQWGGEFPLEVVESVEALKGLGGFMYGFGSPGGIFSYRTKQPTGTPTLSTILGWRNDGVLSVQVDAGGPFAGPGSAGVRVNAVRERGDAYNGAGIDRSVESIATAVPLGDGLAWTASLVHEDSTLEHEPMYFYWDLYEGDRLPRPTDAYRNVTVRNAYYASRTTHATTSLRWQPGDDWQVEATLGGSRKSHRSNKAFGDVLSADGAYLGHVYNFAGLLRSTVAQALVQGRIETGPVVHEPVFGATVQRSWDRWGNESYYGDDFTGNLYEPQPFLISRVPDFTLAPVSADERQRALFASDTLHFGEHWQAILGIRHTRYEQRDVDGDPAVDSHYATSVATPTAAIVYKPVDAASVYASYVESLEAGGRVPTDAEPPYANAGALLEATVGTQVEFGAKLDLGRVSLTTAAFRVRRAAQIDQLDGERRTLVQDGITLYDGFEAIARTRVSDALELGAGVVRLDARLHRLSQDNAALRGNRPAGAARIQAVVDAAWRIPGVRGLEIHANARHVGDMYYEDLDRVRIPGHTVAALGFQRRFTLGDHAAVLTGNVNNLFDRTYWNLDTLGESRNVSLDLRVDW